VVKQYRRRVVNINRRGVVKLVVISNFSVKVIYKDGKPAGDVGVMIDYGWLAGTDEKRSHSLADGKKYSFTI
jgi:hypothetical protein